MSTKVSILVLIVAPIVLELTVALWRRRTAPEPARKLVWLASVQICLPLVATAITSLVVRLEDSEPDALWSFGMPFTFIAVGFYGFSWLATTVAGLFLMGRSQPK